MGGAPFVRSMSEFFFFTVLPAKAWPATANSPARRMPSFTPLHFRVNAPKMRPVKRDTGGCEVVPGNPGAYAVR